MATQTKWDWTQKTVTKTTPIVVKYNGKKVSITPGTNYVWTTYPGLKDVMAKSKLVADQTTDFYLTATDS